MRTKSIDLDDIGFIGDGRSMTNEESALVSAHIQAYKAEHGAGGSLAKHKAKTTRTKGTKRVVRAKAGKIRDLDDIGHIGGDRPYTDEDARIVSAFIQARKEAKPKSKRAAAKKKVVRTTAKRSPQAKTRV